MQRNPDLVDHVLQFGFGRVLSQGSHDGAQLFGGNSSISVCAIDSGSRGCDRAREAVPMLRTLIEQGESFLEFYSYVHMISPR